MEVLFDSHVVFFSREKPAVSRDTLKVIIKWVKANAHALESILSDKGRLKSEKANKLLLTKYSQHFQVGIESSFTCS